MTPNAKNIRTRQVLEKENLQSLWKKAKHQTLDQRIGEFSNFIRYLKDSKTHTYGRQVITPAGREVTILDPYTNLPRQMLMFASNNYLGLANHPYVRKKVVEAIRDYGVGVGGPPLLNGFTKLMGELEARLAAFKHQEDAMIFSTGYQANLGLICGLIKKKDVVVYDELSHASFYDAQRMSKGKAFTFLHNDMDDLKGILNTLPKDTQNIFVGIEGVYSMDGDLAPLDQIVPICKQYGAHILLDDAHGTGVLGATGSGSAEHYGVAADIGVSMGTFSKSFAVTGGFLAASKDMINYLRYFARSYMFSASLPPMTLAAVLAGLDVMEKEPERRLKLLENAAYAKKRLQRFEFYAEPQSPIIALSVPEGINIRKIAYKIHEQGIFLNAIEYPAVSENKQRFRLSIIAEHTKADIDRLVDTLEQVWEEEIMLQEEAM